MHQLLRRSIAEGIDMGAPARHWAEGRVIFGPLAPPRRAICITDKV
jgi:hypothetical protein